MKKKIAITESVFLCNQHDLEAQKNCPFYEPNSYDICCHNDESDESASSCQCDEAIESYISKGFQG